MRSLPLDGLGTPPTSGPGRLLWWFACRQWGIQTVGLALGITQMGCQGLLPWLVGHAVDGGLAHGFGTDLFRAVGMLLALGLVSAAAGAIVTTLESESVTSAPVGGVPVAVAEFVTDPASTFA